MKKRCKFCNGSGRVRSTHFMAADADGIGNVYSLPGLVYISATGSGIEYDVVSNCENCHKERAAIVTAKPRRGKYDEFNFRATNVKLKGGMA